MARIRSIKPEFWSDFPTAQLTRDARLLYVALWNFADEHSRMAGDPRFVKGQVFPYDDDLDPESVDVLLTELNDAGNIVRYSAAGAPYIHLPKLARHQRLETAKVPSRLPEPPDPDSPGPGAHSSESRADKSARDSDEQPVDNPATLSESASSQVRPELQVGTDQSAPDPDESSLLYVAGSRLQVAGCKAAAAAAGDAAAAALPGPIDVLRSKLQAHTPLRGLRFDTLRPDQTTRLVELIAVHGDDPLVTVAIATCRNPAPTHAGAFLGTWEALPPPGQPLHVVRPRYCDTHSTKLSPSGVCSSCTADTKAGNQ